MEKANMLVYRRMMGQLGTITPAEQMGELTGQKPAVAETPGSGATATTAPKTQAVKKTE